MPVIEVIAMFLGVIAFIMTFAYAGRTMSSLPKIDTDSLTNMFFSGIVCLVSIGLVAYAEVIK